MKLYATRFTEGQDLKQALADFATSRQLSSAVIVSAVGSLSQARIRLSGAKPGKENVRFYEGIHEIVSLIGTMTRDGKMHVHISIADKNGVVAGGHLKDGCIVHTTVELVLADDSSLTFSREIDPDTGFDELVVGP